MPDIILLLNLLISLEIKFYCRLGAIHRLTYLIRLIVYCVEVHSLYWLFYRVGRWGIGLAKVLFHCGG